MLNKQNEYQTLLLRLFNESRVDYSQHYSKLFSAFNLWYSQATSTSVDATALVTMKRRPYLWRASFNDDCLSGLLPIMRRIMILTQHRPLERANGEWKGYLSDQYDWQGLIDFWYAIRCEVVHGSPALQVSYFPVLVKLAYESLSIYMNEIVLRTQLTEESVSASLQRYVISPSFNEVDNEPKATFDRLFELHEKERYISTDKPFTS